MELCSRWIVFFLLIDVRAAYGEGRSLSVNDDDDLLEPEDVHYFGSGLTKYYLHIVKLFEKEQVYSYVAELAHVGLQFAAIDLNKVGLFDRRDVIIWFVCSCIAWAVEGESKEKEMLREELLDLAFTGYLKIACYDEAYSAIMRFTDRSASVIPSRPCHDDPG